MIDKRYKAKNWIRSGIAILIGIIVLGISLYYWYGGFEPKLPNRDKMPDWFSEEVSLEKCAWGDLFSEKYDLLVVPYGDSWSGKIEYNKVESIGGCWRGNSPTISVLKPYEASVYGVAGRDMIADKFYANSTKGKNPTADFGMLFDKKYYHKTVSSTVSMNVSFPVRLKNGADYTAGSEQKPGMAVNEEYAKTEYARKEADKVIKEEDYIFKSVHSKRDLKFFVVSPEEMDTVKKFLEASLIDDGKSKQKFLMIFITLVGACFIFYGIISLLKGVVMIIRHKYEGMDKYIWEYALDPIKKLFKG